jgi:hypothetical protein
MTFFTILCLLTLIIGGSAITYGVTKSNRQYLTLKSNKKLELDTAMSKLGHLHSLPHPKIHDPGFKLILGENKPPKSSTRKKKGRIDSNQKCL